jgi:ABC-type Na+ efflux pump permease subunit
MGGAFGRTLGRQVLGLVAVLLGIGLFTFGYWMAFGVTPLTVYRSNSVERLTLLADAIRAAYFLLGGYALYATGSYLFYSLTRTPKVKAKPTEPAAVGNVVIKIRCLTCRQLNQEYATFCQQCGQAV